MIATTTSIANFTGSGSVGPFTFTFMFYSNSDIIVTKGSGGTSTVLVEGVGYTLTGAGSANGGSLTLTTVLASGETLKIQRVVALTQPVQFTNQGAFYPEIHERAIDRTVQMIQQINDTVHTVVLTTTGAGAAPTVTEVDATDGPYTVNLPASGEFIIVKTDSSANEVTLMPTGGDTILRQASITLTNQDESIHIIYSSTLNNWFRI